MSTTPMPLIIEALSLVYPSTNAYASVLQGLLVWFQASKDSMQASMLSEFACMTNTNSNFETFFMDTRQP